MICSHERVGSIQRQGAIGGASSWLTRYMKMSNKVDDSLEQQHLLDPKDSRPSIVLYGNQVLALLVTCLRYYLAC